MENQEIANGRVRGRAWVGVTRGAHRLVAADDPWLADLAAWQSVLPASATFTGLTAARTRGWWLPPLPEDLPVFVAVVTGGGHPDRAGLVLSRHPVQPAYDLLDGLRVATPAEALMACARVLGLLDLVVLVDAALHGGAAPPTCARPPPNDVVVRGSGWSARRPSTSTTGPTT
jgi:hypothetical protein